MSSQQPTYEQLKEKYLQLFKKNKHQKQEIEKCIQNQKVLENGIKERDDAISERSNSIKELLHYKEEQILKINGQNDEIIYLRQQLEAARRQLDEQSNADTTTDTLAELTSAFNTERRDLLTQIDQLKRSHENLEVDSPKVAEILSQFESANREKEKLFNENQQIIAKNLELRKKMLELTQNVEYQSVQLKEAHTQNDSILENIKNTNLELEKSKIIINELRSYKQQTEAASLSSISDIQNTQCRTHSNLTISDQNQNRDQFLEKISELELVCQKAEQERLSNEKEKQELKSRLLSLDSLNSTLNSKVLQFSEEIRQKDAQFQQLSSSTLAVRQQNEAQNMKIGELTTESAQKSAICLQRDEELKKVKKDLENYQGQVVTLSTQLLRKEAAQTNLDRNASNLQSNLDQLNQVIIELQMQLKEKEDFNTKMIQDSNQKENVYQQKIAEFQSDFKQKENQFEKSISELRTKEKLLNKTIGDLQNQIREKESSFSKASLDLQQQIKERERSSFDSMSDLQQKLQEKEVLSTRLDDDLKEKDALLAEMKNNETTMKQKISELVSKDQYNMQTISNLNRQNNEKNMKIDELNQKTAFLENANSELSENFAQSTALVQSLREQLRSTNEVLSKSSNDTGRELEKNKRQLDEFRTQIDSKNDQILQLEGQIQLDKVSFEKREKKLNEIISSMEETDKALQAQLQASGLQLRQLHAQVSRHEQKSATFEETIMGFNEEKRLLSLQIDQVKDSLMRAEAMNSEDKAQIHKLMAERKKFEKLKHKSDQKNAQVEEEKRKLMDRLNALEKDRGMTGGAAGGTPGAVDPKKMQNATRVFPNYIRKVLLQFFIQDGSTRESLIPVILHLVECDEKQINQAQRCWADSNQIISHAFSFFKLK